jgi:hypothetical protein
MRSAALSTVVLTIFLFLTSPAFGVDLCLTPDVLEGFARAKLVFSGKLLKVMPVWQDNGSRTARDYVVSFEVEKWWKGTGSQQVSVVWRSSMFECSYFPVGEIGENYLVYADPLTTSYLGSESLGEVSFLNRTSRLLVRREPDQSSSTSLAVRVLVDSKPPINRADASADLKVLSVLTQCECTAPDSGPSCRDLSLSSGYQMPAAIRSSSRSSDCCECLRRNLKPF